MTKEAEENSPVDLVEPGEDAPATYVLRAGVLTAFKPGAYEAGDLHGKTSRVEVGSVPAEVEIAGPWEVSFDPNRGAPTSVRLDRLISWTEHADPGVKYYSGSAVYEKEFDIPGELLGSGKALELDLGDVKCIASVELNGKDLGIWWKPPFAADISGIAKPGKNSLRVRVTNLWVNRLIGDEQFPDDCEWNGKPLKKWPDWMVKGQPRPVKERITFTTWKHYQKNSPLLPSSLLGPVKLRPGIQIEMSK
jgi:hypothetical protein